MKRLDEKEYIKMLEYFCWHRLSSKSQIFQDLLEKNNYLRVFEKISAFDGWYIKQDIPRLNNIFK